MEKEMATHPSILAWKIPQTEEPGSFMTALAPHERLTEFPVLLREKPHTSATARENLRDAPVIGR